MNSDTPRTDAASFIHHEWPDYGASTQHEYCQADFARTLERENTALKQQVEELRKDKELLDWLETFLLDGNDLRIDPYIPTGTLDNPRGDVGVKIRTTIENAKK